MTARSRSIADAFGARVGDYARHATVHRSILQRLLSFSDGRPGADAQWLDVGCGVGLLGELLAGCSYRPVIWGLDLGHATARTSLRSGNYRGAVSADAIALPVTSGSIDVAVFSAVAQWIEDPAAALGEIRRVLRPGGTALISAFVNGSFAELAALQRDSGIVPAARYAAEEDIRAQIQSAGFRISRAEVMEGALHFSTARRALGHFLALGATALVKGRLDRDGINRLCREYARRFRTPAGVPVTYRALLVETGPALNEPRA